MRRLGVIFAAILLAGNAQGESQCEDCYTPKCLELKGMVPKCRPAEKSPASASPKKAALQISQCRDLVGCLGQCNGGMGASCTMLGLMYEDGIGVPADESKAEKYYRMACPLKHEEGCRKVAALDKTRREAADRRAAEAAADVKKQREAADQRAAEAPAVAVAQNWLTLLDAGEYSELGELGEVRYRSQMEHVSSFPARHAFLKRWEFEGRKLLRIESNPKNIPELPPGEHIRIEYRSTYGLKVDTLSNERRASVGLPPLIADPSKYKYSLLEHVITTLDTEGKWRVTIYDLVGN